MDGNVDTWWYDQPTNGISYIRMKVGLKGLSTDLRKWVPIFSDIFGKMGTKEFKYSEFNDKLMASTTGINLTVESFARNDDVNDSEEHMMIAIGFLDRNIEEAFECITQILTTPNFDDPKYIQDLFR